MTDSVDDRQPVLVGVGTIGDPGLDLDRIELVRRAVGAAFDDAGGRGLSGMTGLVLTMKGSWPGHDDVGGGGARASGVPATARSVIVEPGITQTAVIARACEAVLSGEVEVALVVGVENRARHQRAARSGTVADERSADREPDEVWRPTGIPISRLEIDAGLVEAVFQYAMIENAFGHHDGLDSEQRSREVAELWSRFDGIAKRNPEAWFAAGRSAETIATVSADNRLLAAPYNKWHSTQWTLDQATALVVASADAVRRTGVEESKWVHPLAGADHNAVVPLTERAEPWRCPGARHVVHAALGLADLDLDDVDHIDLYSCFPVAVRVQAREIGLDLTSTELTVTGGMAFAGGPFNHYVLWSTATMARLLRSDPGSIGLVTAVSGMLTKLGAMLWSTEPGDGYWYADVTGTVAAATRRVSCEASLDGAGRVVTFTRVSDGSGWAIVDFDDGRRTLVRIAPNSTAGFDLCGATVSAMAGLVDPATSQQR